MGRGVPKRTGMVKPRILVVDDEEDILELVRYNLERDGYSVTCVLTGEEAVESARSSRPDLLVLDIMLPGLDGLEVCRTLKKDPATAGIPIVMLTAKGEETDVVVGLELGADDYLSKPFSPKVLSARVRAVLRRARQEEETAEGRIEVGDLMIDPRRHEVRVAGSPIELTATEFRILHILARRRGWVFTRDQIVGAIHPDEIPVAERSVDVHIVSLRRKLGPVAAKIETVRGVGYRFGG
jgi:two-component system alkaline phosphatase synthesis response regulator PhoP